MKTAESKTSTAAATAAKTQTAPFFSQEPQAESAFFGGEKAESDSFFSPKTIQPKLTIGAPNDHYEQQADAVADQVVKSMGNKQSVMGNGQSTTNNQQPITNNSSTPSVNGTSTATSTPSVQSKCDHCEQEEKLQKKDDIESVGEQIQKKPIFDSAAEPPPDDVQRKADGGGESTASPDFANQLSSSKGGGSALPPETQQQMGNAIGADFSSVRVHTGSEAANMSENIGAQAFTHGNDVYFNEGKYNPTSTEGSRLLAHELTHTVQQGGGVQRKESDIIQPKLADLEKAGHSKSSMQRLNHEVSKGRDEHPRESNEQQQDSKSIDPKEKASKKRELKRVATPDINESQQQKPKVAKIQQSTKQKIDKGKKGNNIQRNVKGKKSSKKGVKENAQRSKGMARQAMVKAEAIVTPTAPNPFKQIEQFQPEDSQGNPLTPDSAGDQRILMIAQKVQELRQKGLQLKAAALEHEKHTHALDAQVHSVQGLVAENETNLGTIDVGLEERKSVTQEGLSAHQIAHEKQQKVEQEVPKYLDKITESKADSSENAHEAQNLQGQNDANQPSDPEARQESGGVSSGMQELTGNIIRIDTSLGSAQNETQSLIDKTAQAKAHNTASQSKLASTQEKLNTLTAKATNLKNLNQSAKSQLQARAQEPAEGRLIAQEMSRQGDKLIEDSYLLEEKLHHSQKQYREGLKKVTPSTDKGSEGQGVIQRQEAPLGDYSRRKNVFGESAMTAEQRQEAIEARNRELEYIENYMDKPFEQYTRGERIMAGLGAKWQRFRHWLSESLTIPNIVAGIGKAILATFVPIEGIVSGIKMIVNGVVNIFYARDVWDVIKSLADIALGIAVISGVITGFALAVSVVIGILMFFGIGLAMAPVVVLMGQIMSFTGPIALWSGLIAAALNFIAGIKSLYDMGNAETAEQLQAETDDLQQDASGVVTGLAMAATGSAGKYAGAPVRFAGQTVPRILANAQAAAIGGAMIGRTAMAGIIIRDAASSLAAGVEDLVTLGPARRLLKRMRPRRGVPPVRILQNGDTVIITEERIAATNPRPNDAGGYDWELYDTETNAHFAYQHIDRPNTGPHQELVPHEAHIPGRDIEVNLQANGFRFTDVSVRKMIEIYKRLFGSRPPNLSGQIAWGNLENFQTTFARLREINTGMSNQELGNLAIREISYGKHRISQGYGNLSTDLGNLGTVTTAKGVTLRSVPQSVYVHALPTSP